MSILDYELAAKTDQYPFVIGIDEAGRAPLAGPVVASAVLVKDYQFESLIRDSKKLSAAQRREAFEEICDKAFIGVGIMSESVIDRVNILQATFLAMTNAVWQLVARLENANVLSEKLYRNVCLFVDGNRFQSNLPFHYRTIIQGDDRMFSIACASIVAKVIRDRMLDSYHQIYPQYGFQQHKGYPTKKHKQAILEYGPTIIHRRTFKFDV